MLKFYTALFQNAPLVENLIDRSRQYELHADDAEESSLIRSRLGDQLARLRSSRSVSSSNQTLNLSQVNPIATGILYKLSSTVSCVDKYEWSKLLVSI